jgi:hypothetical protein
LPYFEKKISGEKNSLNTKEGYAILFESLVMYHEFKLMPLIISTDNGE